MTRMAVRMACFALLGSIRITQRLGRVAWAEPLFLIWFLFLFLRVTFLISEVTLHLFDGVPLKR